MVSAKEPSGQVTLGICPPWLLRTRLLAAYNLRLHAEGLEPQAEMRLDAEESLAYDDERRDVEDEVRG